VRVAGGDAGVAPYLVRTEGDSPGRRFEGPEGQVLTLRETDELPPDGWELVFWGDSVR
jgi:hypothetical protein